MCYEDNRINQQYSDLDSECNNTCFNKSSKLISESKQCVEDCSLSKTNNFEYNNKCYSKCPSGTIQSSTKSINFFIRFRFFFTFENFVEILHMYCLSFGKEVALVISIFVKCAFYACIIRHFLLAEFRFVVSVFKVVCVFTLIQFARFGSTS